MEHNNINNIKIFKLIGLDTVRAEIQSVCQKAEVYKRCGKKPEHLIVNLDKGSGRTSLIRYMADMYKAHNVLDFSGSRDEYIEYCFDGTLGQLRNGFAFIDSAADYTNEYSNIIGLDISKIALHLNELQFSEFITNIERVCKSAVVVFFVSSVLGKNEERLIEKLQESVDNIRRVDTEPYTSDDICELVIRRIEGCGIAVDSGKAFRAVLLETVNEFDIMSVRDAVLTADTLVRFADGLSPTVDISSVSAYTENRHGTIGKEHGERSMAK